MRASRAVLCLFLAFSGRGALADRPRFLWTTNSNEGTVSKLDAATGAEVARYPSVSHHPAVVIDHVGRSFPTWGAANNPQNVALDFWGNAWVTNVAPGNQPTATKFFTDEPNCPDRNGNLQVDTSREVNGTPGIQTADPLEFIGEWDECIAMTVVVGDLSGQARALAIDRGFLADDGGNAWIGIHNEQAFYQIEGETGALVQRVPPAGASGNSPFSAAVDGNGILWATHSCCGTPRLWRIETLTGAQTTTTSPGGFTCYGSYGMTIDLEGKIWLGGYPCAAAAVYNPSNTTWTEAQVPAHAGWGGLGIGLDREGNVWMALAQGSSGRVARFDSATVVSTGSWDVLGNVAFGAAVGLDGEVFTVNAGSNNVSRLHLDPVTREPAPHPVTGNVVDLFPVGDVLESNGDFTGLAMHAVIRPYPPDHVFSDGFYSGSTNAWSTALP